MFGGLKFFDAGIGESGENGTENGDDCGKIDRRKIGGDNERHSDESDSNDGVNPPAEPLFEDDCRKNGDKNGGGLIKAVCQANFHVIDGPDVEDGTNRSKESAQEEEFFVVSDGNAFDACEHQKEQERKPNDSTEERAFNFGKSFAECADEDGAGTDKKCCTDHEEDRVQCIIFNSQWLELFYKVTIQPGPCPGPRQRALAVRNIKSASFPAPIGAPTRAFDLLSVPSIRTVRRTVLISAPLESAIFYCKH